MDCYIKTKERIAENQDMADTCVLNYDDEESTAVKLKTALRIWGRGTPMAAPMAMAAITFS